MSNELVLRAPGALTRNDPRKLALFKATVGKELRGAEVDEAIEWCEIYGANPFVRDIYFFVFDADKPSRNVVPVLGIGLYRKIAKRSGQYRPDEEPARFTYNPELVSASNPKGMIDCEVSLWIYEHGGWFKVTEKLRWEERAPIKEKWVGGAPSGQFYLDGKKKNWHTMPETMMSKCVEAACIRKAFPEQTAGSYAEGELDRAEVLELTATEIIEEEEARQRMTRIGGNEGLMVAWLPEDKLERIPSGQFGDKVLAFVRQHAKKPDVILSFKDRNSHSLNEFWALDQNAALEVKKVLEPYEAHRPKKAG